MVIDLDEKYMDHFYDLEKTAKATIIKEEPDFWTELPGRFKAGIKKSQEPIFEDEPN
ncbi:MAG TPA: hypothetical protein VIJ27_09595 [Mucilaginibacter sp.]